MIDSLTIKDFQAHQELRVKLSRGITTITGPSDIGKSAIIRALRWVRFNRPSGESFIRDGADEAQVLVVTGDTFIRRNRGKKVNTYTIDGQELEAFGNDVPEQVLKALNLDEVNFQSQLDSPFWFSLSAGEVSRQLNEIINLGIIDSTLSNLASALRKASTEQEVRQGLLEEAKAQREALKPARDMDKALQEVEALAEEAGKREKRASRASQLVEEAQSVGRTHEQASKALLDAEALIKVGQVWQDKTVMIDGLQSLLRKTMEAQALASRSIPDLKPLLELEGQWNVKRHRRAALEGLTDNLQRQTQQDETRIVELQRSEESLKKTIGKECPLCGTVLSR